MPAVQGPAGWRARRRGARAAAAPTRPRPRTRSRTARLRRPRAPRSRRRAGSRSRRRARTCSRVPCRDPPRRSRATGNRDRSQNVPPARGASLTAAAADRSRLLLETFRERSTTPVSRRGSWNMRSERKRAGTSGTRATKSRSTRRNRRSCRSAASVVPRSPRRESPTDV